ncbi:DUF523 domain-containing protein [Desulfobotulus sp. H1]|uniref:DUF523 domain-containing protein n=1 Tax=Desulfobotulus pelophilus TaxID=2823377 RepID=A0ABT3N7D6_9BACT|nr:DUF523 domain-containing protein [Desulfobotulus pelophilus]MCW7753364.1 DUF523 domain-containing protein [Desulfobotulus pelophilus]
MEQILVSSCLLGKKVRYNGSSLGVSDPIFEKWKIEKRILSLCPEADIGMSIPRPPAEIRGGDGSRVLEGTAHVVDASGNRMTALFTAAARMALDLCLKQGIRIAILTEGSPSCGSTRIYDGSFSGKTIAGAGVTASLLRANHIYVFSQHAIEDVARLLQKMETKLSQKKIRSGE